MKTATQVWETFSWETATEEHLKDILTFVKIKEVREKASGLYTWETATEDQLRYILKYAKDEEVRNKASRVYQWETATEDQLRDILKNVQDEETRNKAKPHLIFTPSLRSKETPFLFQEIIDNLSSGENKRSRSNTFFEEIVINIDS